ncbi:MAG: histidine phosphatase family protein [Cyclobacteriaceae bacterium]
MSKPLRQPLIITLLWVGIACTATGQLICVESHFERLERLSKSTPQTIGFIQEDMNLVDDYSKLSQIILLRHGEPALNKTGWRRRKEAIQFVKDYDSVGIYTPEFIPVRLAPDELQVIHTSSIPRSIATAKLVFDQEDIQQPDPLFREFERKVYPFLNIKIPLKWWLNTSRRLWFMGTNKKGIERFSEARKRARAGAGFLEKEALDKGKALLVSHGLLNHYLVKYLKQNGWIEVYDGGSGYLSQKVLVRYGL